MWWKRYVAEIKILRRNRIFTICGICGVFVITLIWIVQNCLLLLSCPVVLIIVIHVCMVLVTLTSQGFKRVQNQLARLVTRSPPFTRSIPLLRALHWLPVRFRILLKINLSTYKTLHEKQTVYVPSMLAALFPSRSLRSKMIMVCQSLGSRPILVQELFTVVPRLFGTTSRCLSIQPFQLIPSRNIWRHISLIWPFPHRYRHSHGLLMLRNCFLDFAVEHWFGCRAIEPGFAGYIGAIEVWLIDYVCRRHWEY